MLDHTIQKWVETAVHQMKFPPDRRFVRQELWDHLLDSRGCWMEQGIDLNAAEEAAVKAMGDPVEIGKQLNRIHRPILSQLWWASRWILIAVLCISIGAAVQHQKHDIFNWDGLLPSVKDWEINGCPYDTSRSMEGPYEKISVRTGAVEQAGVYTLTLHHGQWVRTEEKSHLTLGFRVKAEHLLDMDPVGFGARLMAEDDLGNQYTVGKGVSSSAVHWPYVMGWRKPYVHILFGVDDGVERQWIRFYVPDTEFDITIDAEGRVLP